MRKNATDSDKTGCTESVGEGYAKDYQELIKKYYEALEKMEREN